MPRNVQWRPVFDKTNLIQKITFAETRAAGVRRVLVYCNDYRCSHSICLDADRWADDIRLSDIELRFVCAACGRRGADVKPDRQSLQPRPRRQSAWVAALS